MRFVLFFALSVAVSRATSLGSVFETSDPGGCDTCEDPNVATGTCGCTSGQSIYTYLRTLNDCRGPGIIHGGNVALCASATGTAFGGAYQQDDPVPNGKGCRVPNPGTGACSCPNGFITDSFRTLADDDQGNAVGSHLSICLNTNGADGVFGGAYQMSDAGACLAGNAYNAGACACPASYVVSPVRVLVDGPSGSQLYFCVQGTPPVQVCTGQYADPTGQADATAAIQACIDGTPSGGTLSLPQGVYAISSQITVSSPIVLTTAGIGVTDTRPCVYSIPEGTCATLKALPGCCSVNGILNVLSGAQGSTFAHIVLDGNRNNRLQTPQAEDCINFAYNRARAANGVVGAANVSWLGCASINALCASGLEWTGDGCVIANSYWGSNGDHPKRVSDGLTLLQCRYGSISNNIFIDNSDVNFIHGCSTHTTINGVTVSMSAAVAYAGIMFDDFNGGMCGDYTGMSFTNANIACGNQQCDFGIQVGPDPWYQPRPIFGGVINTVTVGGSKQGINVAGAGVVSAPVTILNIAYSTGFAPQGMFSCGAHASSGFNVAPGNYVNRDGQTNPPATAYPWTGCLDENVIRQSADQRQGGLQGDAIRRRRRGGM